MKLVRFAAVSSLAVGALSVPAACASFTYAFGNQSFTGAGVASGSGFGPAAQAWSFQSGLESINPPAQSTTFASTSPVGETLQATCSGDYISQVGSNSIVMAGLVRSDAFNSVEVPGYVNAQGSISVLFTFRINTPGRYDISALTQVERSSADGPNPSTAAALVQFGMIGLPFLVDLQNGTGISETRSQNLPDQLLGVGNYGVRVTLNAVVGYTAPQARSAESRFAFSLTPVPAPASVAAFGLAGLACARRRR
jgi:hypothetical protein